MTEALPFDTDAAVTATAAALPTDSLSLVVTHLLKGVIYRESDEKLWQELGENISSARDYVAVLGLELFHDDIEGYAFLRSKAAEDSKLPRLVARRQLTFHVSLLLALLRVRLAEFDQQTAETRLVMTREQIAELVSVFMPETSNEVRMFDQLNASIKKVAEMGFLRKLRGSNDSFEVARIIKAFVDAQWLGELDARLADYRTALEEK
ncbi:hypothetical protein CQ010_10565 [Arthrobacter sp. MYb211]|uniref:DUF4194 domain-containing protein n=1 Tax=unclassified Arthrobacter TaxID=235627 RepID=UPI000CFB9522|nr:MULTISPECIES: DUF4194 domain-containing protein [unclassified Arthrobacter]PRA03025.1 hypothetical protein CQ019_11185 [Arthrobacter sp. MYb229]PRA11012.1 hypothetical protein CQ015_11280 [Arthrobacter sp. MYb221]PRB49495.1 hypothetical protein CQ013_12665 [Arthrobacter sp. MYb216]PRC07167.1 hypothetical protein CQ010_10565 [Arthrobacter sp. MYb211]